MPGRRLRIGRIAGIPVGISPWWLLIVALEVDEAQRPLGVISLRDLERRARGAEASAARVGMPR